MRPKTREENFLAKIAGSAEADATMEPRTAEEYWLNEIAKKPSGGGGGGGSAGGVFVEIEFSDEEMYGESSVLPDAIYTAFMAATPITIKFNDYVAYLYTALSDHCSVFVPGNGNTLYIIAEDGEVTMAE